MSEPAQAGKTCDLRGIREAVCVHTGKITDSCLAKDCIEDLRVYLTVDSQHTLDCAASAKARFVELLFVDVQKFRQYYHMSPNEYRKKKTEEIS